MGAWNVRTPKHPFGMAPSSKLTDSGQLFRLAGDFCHLGSKIILLLSIHRNRSAEGKFYFYPVRTTRQDSHSLTCAPVQASPL